MVGHAGSEIPPILIGKAEDSCGPAEIPAAGRGVSPEFPIQQGLPNRGEDRQMYALAQESSPLDTRVQHADSRLTCNGIGTGNQPLYRTSGTDPERDLSLPNRNFNKKPANYDGTSSFQDYLVQFEMTSELNRWSNKVKAMELATSLRGRRRVF